MSVIGEQRGRPALRGAVGGLVLACLVLAVLAVQVTRQSTDHEGGGRTHTETASVLGLPMMSMTQVDSVGGSEASLSVEPGGAVLLVLPLAGALAARRLARRPPGAP